MAKWGNESHCLHTMAKWATQLAIRNEKDNCLGNAQYAITKSDNAIDLPQFILSSTNSNQTKMSLWMCSARDRLNQDTHCNTLQHTATHMCSARDRFNQDTHSIKINTTSNLHREYWGIWVSPFWLVDENLTAIREFRWPFWVSSSRERAVKSIDFIQGSSEATKLTIGNGIDILTSVS